MTDLFFPFVSYMLVVGRTINIVNYDFGHYKNEPIYNQETDIIESPLNSAANASYYVLPDNNIPFEYIRVPVDFLLRQKYEDVDEDAKSHMLRVKNLEAVEPDQALILIVAEQKTSEETVKEGANPVPNWQNHIRDQDHQTHYVDKIVYGSQVISLISIRSTVKGDVQIIRRILNEILGTCGYVGADTVELWKKSEKTIRESPDIRGDVHMDHNTQVLNAQQSYEEEVENLFEYVSKFSEFVKIPDDRRSSLRYSLYVSFKPLHDLDERYPSVQKDVEGRKYLTKLYRLLQDVENTESEYRSIEHALPVGVTDKYQDFRMNLRSIYQTFQKLHPSNLSVFENIDKPAFRQAFEEYQQGLDSTTKDYLTLFRRLREKIGTGITCRSDFSSPTRGVLIVKNDEVVINGTVKSLEECQDRCFDDERCRAIGYADRECLVYYRSTNSATITLLGSDSEGMKIYDRKCSFRYKDDESINDHYPLMSYLLSIGKTIDIVNYDISKLIRPIYNVTDVVENPLNEFNATYYVLPDGNIPLENAHIPVDLLLRIKFRDIGLVKTELLKEYSLTETSSDQALIFVVAEYKTSEKKLKEGTNPVPNWQELILDRDHQTHYVDKIVYGGRVVSLIRIRSIVKGDLQVFRRILQDIMGTSGTVGPDIVDLWRKAERAIRESPDIRGQVYMDHDTRVVNARKYNNNWHIENMLKYVSKLPDFVEITNDEMYPKPAWYWEWRKHMYVSFKPLHDLDERFPKVQKNVDGEKYLAKLFSLLREMEETATEYRFIERGLTTESREKWRGFKIHLRNVTRELKKIHSKSLSAFEYVDKDALRKVFELHQQILDSTTKDYLMYLIKFREQLVTGITCGSDFFTPTRGVLVVEDDEVFKNDTVESLEECQYLCEDDERCRAVGYSKGACLIYYRSTNSAAITLPGGESEDMKIYDRKCRFRYYDD